MVDKLSCSDPSNDADTYEMNYIAALNRLGFWKYIDEIKKPTEKT